MESRGYSHDIEDLINLTDNLDSFDFLKGVNDDYDLGQYWIEEAGIYDLENMGNLANYIDYERFGRDICIEEAGTFTKNGYTVERDSFDYTYGGIEDIPDEYKLFISVDETEIEHENSKISVLLVEPEKRPQPIEIDNTLESKQKLVGGLIQAVYPFDDPVVLICNDGGKLDGLPLNRALYDEDGKIYDIVAGDFFIAALGDNGDFASLSPEQMEKFSERFQHGEQFVKLAGQILAVKMPLEKPKDEPEKTKNDPVL